MAKKKYRIQKARIKEAGKLLSIITGINFGISGSSYKNGIWYCNFYAELDVPHWFDTTIRDTAEEEIRPYIERQYKKIIDALKSKFGEIEHSPSEHWYNFTYYLPPEGVAQPEIWDHVNGVFQKIKDARLLTEKEIEENLKRWEEICQDEPNNRYSLFHLEHLRWSKDNWKKYFKFVGGSPFTDELFVQIRYGDMIRMRGEFSFKAFGEFDLLKEEYMYYI